MLKSADLKPFLSKNRAYLCGVLGLVEALSVSLKDQMDMIRGPP